MSRVNCTLRGKKTMDIDAVKFASTGFFNLI
jgi:hypothetical protein